MLFKLLEALRVATLPADGVAVLSGANRLERACERSLSGQQRALFLYPLLVESAEQILHVGMNKEVNRSCVSPLPLGGVAPSSSDNARRSECQLPAYG